jgi:hypothetical protein
MSTESLSGVWHGLYHYPMIRTPVYFVATLMSGKSWISGSVHEAEVGEMGQPLTLNASIEGTWGGQEVAFDKLYDGSGGWSHKVAYQGTLSPDGLEIEGTWSIPADWTGTFLMIRSPGATEAVVREAFEEAW